MFLGCDLPIQLVLKLLSSEYDNRLEDCFIIIVSYSNTVYHNIDTLKFITEQWVYVQKLSYILDSYYNYVITYM